MRAMLLVFAFLAASCTSKPSPAKCKEACFAEQEKEKAKCGDPEARDITENAREERKKCTVGAIDKALTCASRCDGK